MNFRLSTSYFRLTLCTIALLLSGYCTYAQPSYCTSTLGGSATDAVIVNVAIPGTALNSPSTGIYTYLAFPISGSTTATIQQGGAYTIVVADSLGAADIGMWIDFNQDGVFETYEWFPVGNDITGSVSATFTVPATAHTGVTGLRIRTQDAGAGPVLASDPCTDFFTGETQDYYVTIDTTLPCSGAPAIAAIGGPASICPGSPFTLGISGYTLTTGLTYQWLSHPSGSGSFTAITGATSSSYTAAISAATVYELVIKCTASGLSSTSSAFTVALTPAYMCYCHDSTLLGGESFYAPINSVDIPGASLNNSTPANPAIYSAYPASGSTTASLQQGGSYTVIVNADNGFSDPANISMWIDYNQDGVYEPVEWTSVGVDITGNSVASFTVPFTALTGLTGLRVRTIVPFIDTALGAGDACVGPYGSGETQDYIITIDTTYPCAGIPATATISGPDSICSGTPFTLGIPGYAITAGLTYQWLSAPASSGSFTAIAGATNASYTGAITAATEYELVITCTASGLSSTSHIFEVTLMPFYLCYCDSATLGGSAEYATIDSVSIVGTTLNNYTPDNPFTWSTYPASGSTTATLQQGAYYTIAVNAADFFGDPADISMWIDYNHSGTYDPVEWTLVGTDVLGATLATFTVPTTALTGLTGMRVRTIAPDVFSEFMGSGDACTPYETGETEDYLITIDTTFPCTGTPVAGTISGPDSICNSNLFALSLTGYSVASGITFQWQSRPAGSGSFTAIAGANTPVYSSPGITTATDYNVVVTCTNTGLSTTSATFTVHLSSFFTCYCSPSNGTTFVDPGEGEDEMMEATISGTTFNATGISVPSSTGYVQIPPIPASNTAIMHIGATYNYTVTIDSDFYFPDGVGVWIDYNQDGMFDITEYTMLFADAFDGTYSGTLAIPAGALTGQTGMRVASSDDIVSNASCTEFFVGEVADFVVTIDIATGVSSLANSGFTVKAFPNPVTKSVTIQTFGAPGNNRAIILTDITGRIIEKLSMDTNQTNLDMENLDPGIYFVKYEDEIHTSVMKISKER